MKDIEIINFIDGKNFEFVYDGKPDTFYQCEKKKTESEKADRIITDVKYSYEFGVNFNRRVTYYRDFDSFYLELEIENTSGKNTKQISNIKDFAYEFKFEKPTKTGIGFKLAEDNVKLVTYLGSTLNHGEFMPAYRYIYDGYVREYDNHTGRSSDGLMPYFDLLQKDNGVLVAVGWTGNWRAKIEKASENVKFSSGIADVDFYMEPGEKLKMTTALVTFYRDGYDEGHVKFRNLMKLRALEVGHIKKDKLPSPFLIWGAMDSDEIVRRAKFIVENKLPYNMAWVDAGWYGYSDSPCINEHEGDWGCHTGSWVINKNHHPDEFANVVKYFGENNIKFLLWVEPERVIEETDVTVMHPDWFIKWPNESWMINYGNEDALKGTFDIICGLIDKLKLSVYRQDFNMDPLKYWNKEDKEGRHGITQIKHINGLYKLWDGLLAKYPELNIDGCASGGRRLDFEMCSRCFAVTRSDYQCGFDPDEMSFQNHTAGSMMLLPYLGTYAGYPQWDMNKYTTRSCYAPILSTKRFCYANWDLPDEKQTNDIRESGEEYESVREYFTEDFYNLTPICVNEGSWGIEMESRIFPEDSVWAVWQLNKKSDGTGIIMAFRREKSPFDSGTFKLHGLKEDAMYILTDADTGEKKEYTGKMLMDGIKITIDNPKESKLVKYSIK